MLRRRENPSPKLAWCSFALAASLLLFSPAARATSPGPTDVIRQFYVELQNVMQHATTLGARGRYQKLEPIVLRMFDVPYMARLSIGPSWSKLMPDQKPTLDYASPQKRSGLSWWEVLLLVLAVVAIAISLILPAFVKGRD